jgi:prepilin-type N-terminal cleavage/methylation domain-containing protein
MRTPAARDDGYSLVELMISMTLMSVVTALFTTGIVQVYRAQTFTDDTTETSQQIHNAFIRLDADVRYASGISVPGIAGGSQYVEYLVDNTGNDVCTQLRLTADGRLQLRRQTGSAVPTAWSVLASQLVPPTPLTAAVSFARTPANPNGNAYQQLSVALTAQPVGSSSSQQESSTYTFTALNTAVDTASDTVCNSLART